MDVCTSLIGSNIKLLQSMALLKPPHTGSKAWHQDNAYFRLQPPDVVGVWVALDRATVANGCMHVVAGSHRDGIADHK